MPLSPLCVVREGTGPFVSTLNGVDVSPAASVSVKLTDTTGVNDWFLRIVGTDELSSPPTLVGVDPTTYQVTNPTTVVTLAFPPGVGRALGFRSEVTGVGGPVITTFGVYSRTDLSTRVGFITETREGDAAFGWATKLNPLIRGGGGVGVSPSHLNDWSTTTFTGPGTFELQVDRINRYRASAGLILQFPQAPQDGHEIQIKEVSTQAGTAVDSVTVAIAPAATDVIESISAQGNVPTDPLTEYKTWVKYKYDQLGKVWRIVGAAYQLP